VNHKCTDERVVWSGAESLVNHKCTDERVVWSGAESLVNHKCTDERVVWSGAESSVTHYRKQSVAADTRKQTVYQSRSLGPTGNQIVGKCTDFIMFCKIFS